MQKLTVIIINYNTVDMTLRTVRNFLAMEPNLKAEIILIDNGSKEPFDERAFKSLGAKIVKNKTNLGFAKAVNQGLRLSQGGNVLLLNSDMLIERGIVGGLAAYMEGHPNVGIIGPQFLYPDNRFQPSFGRFPTLLSEFLRFSLLYKFLPGATISRNTRLKQLDITRPRKVDWLSGGCMLIRRELIDEIGLFDENYFLGVEDMDYCYRAAACGYASVYYPQCRVIHYHGFSTGRIRSVMRFLNDRAGFSYFFKKHYPRDFLGRWLVFSMYTLKIFGVKTMNYVSDRLSGKFRPQDATIAVTYRCNSHCRMCNIWQDGGNVDLPRKAIGRLSPDLRYINISGGEPFLRNDLPEIVRIVKTVSPKAQIIISSNGYLTETITATMRKIMEIDPEIGVRISLDGTEATHDRIRGVNGMYKRACATIDNLRELGIDNLGISFTIMSENIGELKAVYRLAETKELQFAIALVQNSEIYFKKDNNNLPALEEVKAGLMYVIKNELSSFNPKRWLRAFYDFGLLYYAERQQRLLPSGAGFDSLFIDPLGDVYPSNLIDLRMGNLLNDKLDTVWRSGQAQKVRQAIKQNNISESWIICTIRGQMKSHPVKVLSWVIRQKLLLPFKG